MGYATDRALAFLMTVFNIRLGWWLGNPCHDETWKSDNPSFGLWCLLSELLGLTNSRRRYVYLSDGGHFENLGLYELVRRRCRYILVSDAACDPKLACRDLANAVEKCRTDFGIEIEIDVQPIRDGRACWRAGTIHYRRRDGKGAEDGVLVYLKSSMLPNRQKDSAPPLYVSAYGEERPAFPHETTADQWFSESQFKAYRGLGQYLAETALRTGLARKLLDDTAAAGGRTWKRRTEARTRRSGAARQEA